MTHISKIDNEKYDIMEGICPEDGKTYDITFIVKFPSEKEYETCENDGEDAIANFVGWYFGSYEFEVTEDYIDDYINAKSR